MPVALAISLAVLLHADAPHRRSVPELRVAQVPRVEGVLLAQAETSRGGPEVLQNARRLAEELRYEEAVVDYQRYLAVPDRPLAERARALFELAFIHLVLGDERNAQQRAFEALELDETLQLPADAPSRQVNFLKTMRQRFEARTRLEILPSEDADAPQRIRARLQDPQSHAREVLLRHALGANGPFFAQRMHCEAGVCTAEIPAPKDAQTYTAWYWVEALDKQGNTVARGASAESPLRVSIVEKAPWYRSPYVYAGGAAALIGAAAVFYIASAPPTR